MKKFAAISVLAFCAAAVHAQSANSTSTVLTKVSSQGTIITVLDKDGKPFAAASPNSNAEGSPFYNDSWQLAVLRLSSGKVVNGVKVRLNIYSNTLHFLNNKGEERYLDLAEISRVELPDSLKKDSVAAGFIRLSLTEGGRETTAFFKVLAEGKLLLVQRLRKKLRESKDVFSGNISWNYELYEDYYVFAGNELKSVKRKASFWEELMQDNWTAVQAYAGKNDLDFKTISGIQQLVMHYNSISKPR